ncbi:Na+/H+ antiporter subunit E [Flaviflexus equikiangi]|nr:Na+/H+ antiporter subunit E [Flaviflexus equikiangi]
MIATLPFRMSAFAAWFIAVFVKSSGTVLLDILVPGYQATPRIVRLPLGDVSSYHATTLSILITLTPGTVALGVTGDDTEGTTLLVHSLHHASSDEARDSLLDMNRRLARAYRIGGRNDS